MTQEIPSVAVPPTDELAAARAAFRLGVESLREGRWEDALEHFDLALPVYESRLGTDAPETLNLTHHRIHGLFLGGRWKEAEPVLRRLIDDRVRMLGEAAPGSGEMLEQMADLQLTLGRRDTAVEFLGRAVDVHWASGDDDRFAVCARLLDRLVELEIAAGRWESVAEHLVRLATCRERLAGETAPDVLETLRRLGDVTRRLERPQMTRGVAVELASRLRRAEAQGEDVDPDGFLRAHTVELLLSVEHFDGAEPLLVRLVDLRRDRLGRHDPVVAQTLDQLAAVRLALGRIEDALPSLREHWSLLGLQERDPRLRAAWLRRLAEAEDAVGEASAAETHWRRLAALELRDQPARPTLPETIRRLVDRYRSRGDRESAEGLVDESLEAVGGRRGGDPRAAELLDLRAALWEDAAGRWQAERCLRDALDLRREALGDEHPDTAATHVRIADLYADEGRFDEAEELYRRSLRALQDHRDPRLGNALQGLGEVSLDRGEAEAAERWFERAQDVRRWWLAEEDLRVAESAAGLARAYREQGRWREAEERFARAHEICVRGLSAEHPQTATRAVAWGECLCDLERFAEAEALLESALAVREGGVGPDHPNLVTVLSLLGRAAVGRGDLDAAADRYARALDLHGAHYGSRHRDRIALLDHLGAIRWRQGRVAEAAELHEEAVRLHELDSGADAPGFATTLGHLAAARRSQGDPSSAAAALHRAVELLSPFPEDPRLPRLLDRWGAVCAEGGDPEAAEGAYERSLAIREEAEPGGVDAGWSLIGLAAVRHRRGRLGEAETFYRRGLMRWETRRAPTAPEVLDARRRYRRVLAERRG